MTKNKKILMSMVAICLVAALAIGGTLAFLTDTAKRTNVFTIGDDIDVALEEPGWTPEDGEDLAPGDSMTKDPTIIGLAGESYARLVVSFIDKNGDKGTNPNYGEVITDPDRIALILQTIYYDTGSNIVPGTQYTLADVVDYLGFNTTDFTLDSSSNGVYYYNYNGTLSEGEEATLFTHIVIPSEWDREQMQELGDFDIDIVAQAIQTTGFANADDAYAALTAQLNQ